MFTCAVRGLRRLTLIHSNIQRHLAAGYKSQISLDKLYPNSDSNPFRTIEVRQSHTGESEEPFSGHIPVDELDVKFTKSSGPGGQNVNNVNTKVIVRFNVDTVSWIPEWIKPRFKEQQSTRLTKSGDIIISSDKTRKQLMNRADCMERIRHMVFTAAIKPKEQTEEELILIEKRKAKAQREAIQQKRRRSDIKHFRRGGDFV